MFDIFYILKIVIVELTFIVALMAIAEGHAHGHPYGQQIVYRQSWLNQVKDLRTS